MNNWKNKNLFIAFKNAVSGILQAIKSQINLKIQIVVAIIVIALGFLFNFNINEFVLLIITIFIVIITEMINTAIEATLNLYTEEYSEKVKKAKDISAGAVVLSAMCAIIVGILLFGSRLV